jgi:hypothetical protein
VGIKPPSTAVLLRTTAHADHPVGVNIVPRTLNASAPFSVDEAVQGGATSVKLNTVAGLAGNAILRFGVAAAEYVVVDTVDAGANRVTLRDPLTHSYTRLAPVQEFILGVAGPPIATTRSIDAGDGVLILAAVLNAPSIEISDGLHTEYHDTGLVADADGFFVAGGIAGVPSLVLRASAGGFQDLDADWFIDYSRPVAALSFRLKP